MKTRKFSDIFYGMLSNYMARTGMMLFAFDPADADTKAALSAAVEEAVKGLKAKNDELLTEVRTLKKGRTIDPSEVEKLERQIEELTGQRDAANKAAKDAAKAAENATKALQTEAGFTQKLLIDNGLTAELTKHGVTNPVHIKAAQAMLRANVQIAQDGENRIAKVGDKALGDFVKEWASGEEGKHFVTAASNGGGGASGGAGKPGAATLSRTAFSALAPAQQAAHVKGGGTLTD